MRPSGEGGEGGNLHGDDDMTVEEFNARFASGTPVTIHVSEGVTVTRAPAGAVVTAGPRTFASNGCSPMGD